MRPWVRIYAYAIKARLLFGVCPFGSFGHAKERTPATMSSSVLSQALIHFVDALFARPKRAKKAAHQIKCALLSLAAQPSTQGRFAAECKHALCLQSLAKRFDKSPVAHRRAFDGIAARIVRQGGAVFF